MNLPVYWMKYRFVVEDSDYRPYSFPPPGPYWCSGFDEHGNAVLIAYLKSDINLKSEDLWPDALIVDTEVVPGPFFSDRFPKPEWYTVDELVHSRPSKL